MTASEQCSGDCAQIAVLLPARNFQSDLDRTLRALKEEEAGFDVFVVDDGSDPPLKLIGDLPFDVTILRLDKNQGVSKALNHGLREILEQGYTYIARLDADDVPLPGRFSTQKAHLDAHPDCAMVAAHALAIDDQGRERFRYSPPMRHGAILRRLRYTNPICHPTVMFRATAVERCGLYDERFRQGQDYEMHLRLARRYQLAALQTVYLHYRLTESQVTRTRSYRYVPRLVAQIRHFAPMSIHSYLGVMRTLSFMLLPYSVTCRTRDFFYLTQRRFLRQDDISQP